MIECEFCYVCDVCGNRISGVTGFSPQKLYESSPVALPSRILPEGWHWCSSVGVVCAKHKVTIEPLSAA
jgi:hypothetical protein